MKEDKGMEERGHRERQTERERKGGSPILTTWEEKIETMKWGQLTENS